MLITPPLTLRFFKFKSFSCQEKKKVKEVIKLGNFDLFLLLKIEISPPPPKQAQN